MLIMLLALFLVTMFLGTPIAFSMSFASIVTNLTHGASSLMLTAQQCYDSTSNLSLPAVCRTHSGRPGYCGSFGCYDFCSNFRQRPRNRGGLGCVYDPCHGE